MAGGQERILRGRIRTVQATKKITRAMELIAASRIVKAQQRVHAAVPYSEQITAVVKDLAAAGGDSSSPLLSGRPITRTKCYVAIAADRGLCGGYNSGVLRAVEGEIKADVLDGKGYQVVAVGRRAEAYLKFRGYRLGATFSGFSHEPSYAHARDIGQRVVAMYEAGEVDSVELVYTRFISPGSQEVVIRPLVPLEREVVIGGDGLPDDGVSAGYEFEPDPGTILDTLLPRYVEARTYAALLNAAASEHAFRQRAMKAATDNAEELIKSLSRIMNRARQDSITTEIMEIVSGAEALGSDHEGPRYVPVLDEFGGSVTIQPAVAPRPGPESPAGERSGPAVATAVAERDDLEREIEGIGPVIGRRLADMGVTTFRQIAEWTDDDIERIGAELDFPGRIEREDWVGQAKRAHQDKYGDTI
ncbi:MAG: F0F1 ATP synthase subunit gamma [Acidimicrobiia bacterium]